MLISVIIPIYNVELYIERCLESIAFQYDFDDYEVIMVDDGSTDGSTNIARKYEKEYKNFKYYRIKNSGLSEARNYGFSQSQGKYICFVDSDDFVSNRFLLDLYKSISKDDSDMCICKFKEFTNDEELLFEHYDNKYYLNNCSECLKKMLIDDSVGNYAWNKMYKRSVICEYPKSIYFEDIYTTYKSILKSKKICFIDDILYFYRRRPGSIVSLMNEKKVKDYITGIDLRYNELCKIVEIKEELNINRIKSYVFIFIQASKILSYDKMKTYLDKIICHLCEINVKKELLTKKEYKMIKIIKNNWILCYLFIKIRGRIWKR